MTDIVYGAQPVKHTDELHVEQDHKGSQSVKCEYKAGESLKKKQQKTFIWGYAKSRRRFKEVLSVCVYF